MRESSVFNVECLPPDIKTWRQKSQGVRARPPWWATCRTLLFLWASIPDTCVSKTWRSCVNSEFHPFSASSVLTKTKFAKAFGASWFYKQINVEVEHAVNGTFCESKHPLTEQLLEKQQYKTPMFTTCIYKGCNGFLCWLLFFFCHSF